MTEQELLQSTIDYYSSDTNRRCVKYGLSCKYSPKLTNKEDMSEGCAIGRFLKPDVQELFDNLVRSGIMTLFGNEEFKSLLPDWMQKMNPLFLGKIQSLHDSENNWNIDEGLSLIGKGYVKEIIKEFNLVEPTYK